MAHIRYVRFVVRDLTNKLITALRIAVALDLWFISHLRNVLLWVLPTAIPNEPVA